MPIHHNEVIVIRIQNRLTLEAFHYIFYLNKLQEYIKNHYAEQMAKNFFKTRKTNVSISTWTSISHNSISKNLTKQIFNSLFLTFSAKFKKS